MVFIVAVITNY